MEKIGYINPVFKDLLDRIPPESQRESELSYAIARRINEILLRKGWSQTDLAKATGKPAAAVSRWMSGTQNFTLRTIALIETSLEERILSVNHYYRPAEPVSGYALSPKRQTLLNDPGAPYGKGKPSSKG